MAWYGAHGQQTYYEDTGRGDPVVLLPGWGGSITELNQLRRELGQLPAGSRAGRVCGSIGL